MRDGYYDDGAFSLVRHERTHDIFNNTTDIIVYYEYYAVCVECTYPYNIIIIICTFFFFSFDYAERIISRWYLIRRRYWAVAVGRVPATYCAICLR